MDTDAPYGEAFIVAKAEAYNLNRDDWVEREGISSRILYTGDWNPCTQAEAFELIENRRKRQAPFS
ncbi:hypothetical protein ABQF34_23350 [Mycolicibacterium boenickei]